MNNSGSQNSGRIPSAILVAIFSAILFGLSTPFAKMLTVRVDSILLAGLLYFGSGLGLGIWFGIRALIRKDSTRGESLLSRSDLPWLIAAVVFGGMAAPALLMIGLAITSSSTASLLLNLEIVCTLLIAWFVFNEGFSRRIVIGAIAIIAGGLLLSWPGGVELSIAWGPLWIALACLAWGVDNNLTRRISSGDPVQIAAIKGLFAGGANIVLALFAHRAIPNIDIALLAGLVGFLGYGLSLVFFILGLRHLGASRTAAYFAVAPFIGAIASFAILGEKVTAQFLAASCLIAIGIYLHISEQHVHEHAHQEIAHEHRHVHDEHHAHDHGEQVSTGEPHAHFHEHSPTIHSHPHYPDIHHRHGH